MKKKAFRLTLLFSMFLSIVPQYQAKAWVNSNLAAGAVIGTGYNEGYSIVSDSSGNFYLGGYYRGTTDFDLESGVSNSLGNASFANTGYLAKYSPKGALTWVRTFMGTGSLISDLALDSNGNVIAAGWFSGSIDFNPNIGFDTRTAVGSNDSFAVKLTANGDYLWARTFGGSNGDVTNSMSVDGSGNVLVGGTFSGSVDFNPGAGVATLSSNGTIEDAYVLKLDPDGLYLWANRFGGTSTETVYAIEASTAGDVYITGQFNSVTDFDPSAGTTNKTPVSSTYDLYLLKLSSSGSYSWVYVVGGDSQWEQGYAIDIDSNGDVILGGSFGTSADFDAGVGVFTMTSAGSLDAFIMKITSAGSFAWVKRMGFTGEDYLYSIALDASNNVYYGGRFTGTTDLNPGAETVTATASGTVDGYVVKLDSTGTYQWARSFGSTGNEQVSGLTIDPTGNLIATGYFSTSVDLDFTSGVSTFITSGGSSAFVFKLSSLGVTEPSGPKTMPTLTFALGAGTITKITYRTNFNIVVNSDVAGKVTFIANGKRVAGCISKPITTSYTCVFKSSIRGAIMISATLTPTVTAEYTSASTGLMTLLSAARSNTR